MTDQPSDPSGAGTIRERLLTFANRAEQSATERFESDAERFYAETGYMAPGKSVPLAMADGGYEDRRDLVWREWGSRQQQHYIQTLREAAAALPLDGSEAQGWQPIETAPKDGTNVLVANARAAWEARWNEGLWYEANNDPTDAWGRPSSDGDLLGWMPLPAPPARIRELEGQ